MHYKYFMIYGMCIIPTHAYTIKLYKLWWWRIKKIGHIFNPESIKINWFTGRVILFYIFCWTFQKNIMQNGIASHSDFTLLPPILCREDYISEFRKIVNVNAKNNNNNYDIVFSFLFWMRWIELRTSNFSTCL